MGALMLNRESRAEKNAFENLLQACLKIDPSQNKASYLSDGTNFANLSQEVSDKIEEFKHQVSNIPVVALALLWANHFKSEENFNYQHIEMMYELLKKKLIFFKNPKTNQLPVLSDLKDFQMPGIGHYFVISSIRCYGEWSIEKRESYVSFYTSFFEWISKITFGYIPIPFDPDRELSKGRLLKYDIYIKVINNLLLRERILAKIFYLSCSKNLKKVLSLKISDVKFKECTLKFSEGLVDYPSHLFQDLKEYIGARKTGFIFISREGNQIDATVPYRALKAVINKLDLDKSFTFADFLKSA